MKLYSVSVNIIRKNKLHHCGSCSCRTAEQVIGSQVVYVHDDHREISEIKSRAQASVSCKWSEEKSKDYGGYEFEAQEPVLIQSEVV